MGRQHIHFTPSLVQTQEAKSGFRSSCNVLIFLDVPFAMHKGLELYRSSNNVILSPGFDGVISPIFFEKVVDRYSDEIIFTNKEKKQAILDAESEASKEEDVIAENEQDVLVASKTEAEEAVQPEDNAQREDA